MWQELHKQKQSIGIIIGKVNMTEKQFNFRVKCNTRLLILRLKMDSEIKYKYKRKSFNITNLLLNV